MHHCTRCQLRFHPTLSGGVCPNCGEPGRESNGDAGSLSTLSDPRAGALADTGDDLSGIEAATTRSAGADVTRVSLKILDREARKRGEATAAPGGAGGRVHPSWAPGTIIAERYEVVEKVGEGGFGSVYKVRHLQRKKLYALKTPHPEYLQDQTFRRRFEREIQALERFVHPDVVTIRDSGTTGDGLPYYTMDFVEGESLRRVMARDGQLSLERSVRIIERILLVLEVAHRNKIIHRDIKPDNILLTREGEREVVKLLDFGVVKLLDLVGKSLSLTRNMRVGTPKYMSPEQVTGDPVDGRSDIFAVGILFYELVTGQHPFEVPGDPIRTTAAILRKQPRPPGELRPEAPDELIEAMLLFLRKKPDDRPADARAARAALPDLSGRTSRSTLLEIPNSLHPRGRRERVRSLVLTRKTPEGPERSILFFQREIRLGRAEQSARGQVNDLILRRLPCRSRTRDPENWQANLTISQSVATIGIERSQVVIRPAEESRYGIVVGGLRSHEAVRIPADRFHLSLGDQALELEGLRVLRNTRRDAFDLSFIAPLDENEDPELEGIGYSDPDCSVDTLRLTRGNNHPLHRYFLVHRRLTIGSGVSAGMQIPEEEGLRGNHATIIHDRGEAFLGRVEGDVNVALPSDGEPVLVPLEPRVLFPLVPGLRIRLGSTELEVGGWDPDIFKNP